MQISRLLRIGMIVVCAANSSSAYSQPEPDRRLIVRPVAEWTNVFAGKSVVLKCEVSAKVIEDAVLNWSVSVERGVIARGERAVKLVAGQASEVTLTVDFPEIRPGVIVPAALILDVRTRSGERAQRTVELHVFSLDIASNREQWLKSLDIVLFDPSKKTAEALESSRIPTRFADGPNGVDVGKGLILYGEGIESTRLEASWQAALEMAASGRRVVMLASSGASVPMDRVLIPLGVVRSAVSLRESDFIQGFDKRLDATTWPAPGRMISSTLHWDVRSGVARIESRTDASGWPVLDIRYRNGGRFVWIGFGVIESWEATPAARYFFVKLLEDVMSEKNEWGGSKHAEK